MQLISSPDAVAPDLARFVGQSAYLHLEATMGAYTENGFGVFIRNAEVRIERAGIRGQGPLYRAGIQTSLGWVYAEGLTHWEVDGQGRLLLEGHDPEGRLTVACLLSPAPFPAY